MRSAIALRSVAGFNDRIFPALSANFLSIEIYFTPGNCIIEINHHMNIGVISGSGVFGGDAHQKHLFTTV